MSLERNQFRSTPEGHMVQKQNFDRAKTPLNELSTEYISAAGSVLAGRDGVVVRDEMSRFSEAILTAREGYEQKDAIDRSISALLQRRPNLFEDTNVPDGEKERAAFVVALAREYKKTLH